MNIQLLSVTTKTASFELDSDGIFYSPKPFDVSLNGKVVYKDVKENVFSLFDLEPDTEYTVSAYGAEINFKTKATSMLLHISDFKTLNKDDTATIQAAIAVLPPNGTLIIDEGEYHVTSLYLKSEMTLYLAKGATIYGDTVIEDYPLVPGEYPLSKNAKPAQFITWEGTPLVGKPSLINGFYLHDVDIAGEGTINGMASESHFWDDVKHLTYARPRMIYFNKCENIQMVGVTVENSPSWTIHPYFSNHLGFYNLKIRNPKDAPNTDGLNPECCSDVKIIGVDFSVGDDCIALKSGKIYIGKTYKTPTKKVVIRNCHMAIGHGAIVLGSEVGAGLDDITVSHCFFDHTDRGLRIKSRRGRGKDSTIDNIVFKDIRMDAVLTPLVINMFYFCDPDGKDNWVQDKRPAPVSDKTPYLGSFVFERIKAVDVEWCFGFFYGLPEQPIGKIEIKDSSFSMKANASEGLPAMMCGIEPMRKSGFVFTNVKEAKLDHVVSEGYIGERSILEKVGSFKEE